MHLPPAEDEEVPFCEEDAQIAQAQRQSTRDLQRLIAGERGR
jgi:hypothetical protein